MQARMLTTPALLILLLTLSGISCQSPDSTTPELEKGPVELAPRPNIIFILCDDMGWAQPGFHGGNPELTPNLDRLAAEGMRLTRFYTHSVCSPTRAAFLTGRYAFRTWMDWRSEDFGKPSYLAKLGLSLAHDAAGRPTRRIHALDTSEYTIAEALGEAGYFTALAGKWHMGEWLEEHLPHAQGFHHQYGHYGWGIDYWNYTIPHNAPARYAVYDWHRNQEPLREEGYATDLIAAEVVRLLERRDEKRPFFYYVPFNAVHGPIDRVPRYTDRFDARSAALKCLDDAVGEIVGAVDRLGLARETLIVFANDNGGLVESMSRPYRGTKNTTFEGGVRVPCLIRWPGKIDAGSTSDEMMFIADFYRTLAALGGARVPADRPLDSFDMTGVLLRGEPGPREEIVFEVEGSVRLPTILEGRYKLMGETLYDLENDPGEREDVASRHPEIVARLKARLSEMARARPPLGDKPLLMDPPLPVIYGQRENRDPPDWLLEHVEKVRATQPDHWPPGETPWPQAPKGAHASTSRP